MRHLNWPSLALAATLLPLCASADVRAWRADLASEEVRNEYVRRGDSATLRVAVYLRGREYRPTTAVARYRAGLDSPDWLQAPCSVASNVVEVAWTPMLAPGADVVPMLLHVDGEVYRVPIMLYVRDSPGGDGPGTLPVLDLAAYSVTNAPWIEAERDPVALHRLASPGETAEAGVDEAGVVRSRVRVGGTAPVWVRFGDEPLAFGGPVDTSYPARHYVPGAAAGQRMSRAEAEAGWHIVAGDGGGEHWGAADWTLRSAPGRAVVAWTLAGPTNLVEIWRDPATPAAVGREAWLSTAWRTNDLATAEDLRAAGDALLARHRADLSETAAAILDDLDEEATERVDADDRLAADVARRLLLDDPDQGRAPVRITAHTSGGAETERRVEINGRLAVGEADNLTVGSDALAVGAHVAATGDQSLAAGWGNEASGGRSVALGLRTAATAPQAVAAGADAVATNANAAVWSGVETGGPQWAPPYGSHGVGSWSVNPVGGAAGAWIGETPLVGLIPEYLSANETDRRTAYTATSRDAALRDGKLILLHMPAQPSAAWTLNLTLADGTTTGARPVRFWGGTAIGTQYAADSILPLVYRAGAWYFSDRDTNNDTYDRVRVNTAIRAAAAISRNRMCVGSADGYRGIAAGVTFDSTYPPLYLNRTSTLSAGATETQFYASFPGINAAYTVSAWPGKQRAALYLVGSLADDGRTFTIGDPALSYDPTPPCIPLGIFHATTTNSFYFCPGPLITGATGGGADTGAVTNLVSDILTAEVDALPVESTLEVHRLVLADLWDRVDRMAGSSDADAIDDLRLAISGLDARLTALEESAASTAASISALSAMSSLRLQSSDLQAPGTVNASAVQSSELVPE